MKQRPIFVFDLDGVITNPSDSSVDGQAVRHIYELLKQGHLTAVNTGRSYQWVAANLLRALTDLGAACLFEQLYIVCEKGGVAIQWDSGAFVPQPSRFALSGQLYDCCREVFGANAQHFGTMFWDDTKQTMATIEKRPEASLGVFRVEQQLLTEKLHEALKAYDVHIDATTIATDVESAHAGKRAGAELVYEWVTVRTAIPGLVFISFGDSHSDYEMARYFAQAGSGSTFVFVGAQTDTFIEDPRVSLVRTTAKYATGTCEYFSAAAG